jgi:hypothetical protein
MSGSIVMARLFMLGADNCLFRGPVRLNPQRRGALSDARKREAIGRIVSRILQPIRTMPPCSMQWKSSVPTQKRKP